MPRKRDAVKESVEQITALLEQVRETKRARPLQLLLLLRQRPDLTITAAADEMSISERTARRWWMQYRLDGLTSLTKAPPPRRRRLSPDEMNALRDHLAHTGFSELKDAQTWLLTEFGTRYSISGVANLLREIDAQYHSAWHAAPPPAPIPTSVPVNGIEHSHLLQFISAIPEKRDIVDCAYGLREALLKTLPDIDWVSTNLNVSLADPRCKFRLLQAVKDGQLSFMVHHNEKDEPVIEYLMRSFRKTDFPEIYHTPPIHFNILDGNTYLGSLLLWQKKHRPVRDPDTIAQASAILPYMPLIFSDMILRYRVQKPIDEVFRLALDQLQSDISLGVQEFRVLSFRLIGYSYKEISQVLSISVGTVKKHLHSVHVKTGIKSQVDLLSRYLSPRISEIDLVTSLKRLE